ncbi:hypothetical protein Bpla01_37780 [Burkholderia plantarii]|nr:hypothetical protein Bpla01_37780 [Burkholderia plantarii]
MNWTRCINGLVSYSSVRSPNNGGQLAEWIGESTPGGVQHLLERARPDVHTVPDILRKYVVEHFGVRDAVLIVDKTGFLKEG